MLRWPPVKRAKFRASVVHAVDKANAAYGQVNNCRPRHLLVHTDPVRRPIKVEAQEQ